ncbi:MAG: FAD:protein FMN transferase [Alphaproteobacteria bacterium]|nr:MAG: FAD:protein FMN transferase [Alphaproteobacteria bacterium]
MGTTWTAELVAPAGADIGAIRADLAAAVETVDAQMSTWKPESDLMRLNRAEIGVWTEVPAELFAVIEAGLEIGAASGGRFDIGLGGLVRAWGFGPADPDETAIRAAMGRAVPGAGARLELDRAGRRIRKTGDVALDLCGIAKGYALDLMAEALGRHGVENWLVTLDGDLRAQGRKGPDTPWIAALEAPLRERRTVHGYVEVVNAAVATSGDYRNWVALEDRVLSHTMDPRNGLPCLHDLASVTVIAPTGLMADAWATALLVAGPDAGPALAEEQGLHAIFLRRGRDGTISELEVGAGD